MLVVIMFICGKREAGGYVVFSSRDVGWKSYIFYTMFWYGGRAALVVIDQT